jgi:hypothetical protein
VALNTINPKPIMNVIKGHHSSLACSSCAEWLLQVTFRWDQVHFVLDQHA